VQNQNFERSEPELAQSFILPLAKNIFFEPSVRHLFRYDETLFQINMPMVFESSRLWLMYSEGFRPPSLTDLYAQTSYFRGNPQLQPEKSQQYEFGQSWQHQGVTLSNSLFLLKYKDLLQSSVLPSSEFTKINVGKAETYGMSAKLEITQPHWQAHLSHTYMIARETPSNVRLRFSPEHQTFASLHLLVAQKQTLTLQHSVWSPLVDLDFINNRNVRLTDWSSTDVLWMYRWRDERSLQMGVYNLWNQRRELTYGYPEPQRRVALAFETTF
jgi:vitamin B12 transporter